jgi:hypothetical protein
MKDQYTSTYNNLLFAYSQTSELSTQIDSHRSRFQLGLRVPDSFKYSSIKMSDLMLESVTMKIHKHSLMNFLSNNDFLLMISTSSILLSKINGSLSFHMNQQSS